MSIRAAALVLASLSQMTLAQAQPSEGRDWTTYRNERYGFSLGYPADVFQVERTSEAGDGQVLVSRDGEARLLLGALPNTDHLTPTAYQDLLARQSYGDYSVTYRRASGSWFVLSGEGNGKTFYEKVIFSCGGRVINSFAMLYPTDRGRLFDRVVEGIEKSFRSGTRGCSQELGSVRPEKSATDRSPRRMARHIPSSRSALADRIARVRGQDVLVVLRRRGPPHDYKVIRGYASR